jgi:hypothetical protein
MKTSLSLTEAAFEPLASDVSLGTCPYDLPFNLLEPSQVVTPFKPNAFLHHHRPRFVRSVQSLKETKYLINQSPALNQMKKALFPLLISNTLQPITPQHNSRSRPLPLINLKRRHQEFRTLSCLGPRKVIFIHQHILKLPEAQLGYIS